MTTKNTPIEVLNWDELVRYTQFLSSNGNKKYKICLMDEEQEEIRIENKDEFESNVKYAKDHGLKSITLVVYIDDVHSFDGIYCLEKSTMDFPTDKLKRLRENVLAEKWYIPVKVDEAFGICLNATIKLAQEGKMDGNNECKEFIEEIVPEAFRKLFTSQAIFKWPREIDCGVFDLAELLVDLVGIRLRYPPAPVALLNTLAIIFDTNTTFAQKHKDEQIPSNRVYQLKDNEFLNILPAKSKDSFGWICSLIQRFIAQNGLVNLCNQFEFITKSTGTINEYHSLLELFSKCHQCINAPRFRSVFTRAIRQSIRFHREQKTNKQIDQKQFEQFNETLIDLCFQFEMNDEVNEILQITTKDSVEQLPDQIQPVTVTKKRSSAIKTYDRSNPDEIRRFFAPMKEKISTLYDNLQTATSQGDLRRVLKIQDKLKLLHPYSARFIADENIPNGTGMQPGQVFRKNWILLNDGSLPWDNEDIQLTNLFDGIEVIGDIVIPVTAPHERATITVEYRSAEQVGDYESKWILSYRDQTFGPMLSCSIRIGQKVEMKKEKIEFADIPLPACFDLTKPYQSTYSHSNSIYTRTDSLVNSSIDSDDNSIPLIDLTPTNDDGQSSTQSNHSANFVTNIFKQAGSKAKAIFNTLQGSDEIDQVERASFSTTTSSIVDDFFEHVDDEQPSNEPMNSLIEMGFTNRAQNQRLLQDHHNDLNKVIEILTLENFD